VSDQVSSLEREIEQTREHLGATIDQLLYRAPLPQSVQSAMPASMRSPHQ
jgi:hypothetical protein